jgi:hypothetical protein
MKNLFLISYFFFLLSFFVGHLQSKNLHTHETRGAGRGGAGGGEKKRRKKG